MPPSDLNPFLAWQQAQMVRYGLEGMKAHAKAHPNALHLDGYTAFLAHQAGLAPERCRIVAQPGRFVHLLGHCYVIEVPAGAT